MSRGGNDVRWARRWARRWALAILLSIAASCIEFHHQRSVSVEGSTPTESYEYGARFGLSNGYIGWSDEELDASEVSTTNLTFSIHQPLLRPPWDLGDWFGYGAFRVAPWYIAIILLASWWGASIALRRRAELAAGDQPPARHGVEDNP